MTSVALDVRGPYALAQSRDFLRGFTPATGSSADVGDALALAFRADGTFAPTGVVLRQSGLRVTCDVVGGGGAAAAAQAARMLAIDVDGTGWGEIGARDAVLGALLARYEGFRPVAFASPWEAGVWGLLVQRISMPQAAAIKRKVAEAHGDVVTFEGGAAPASIALFPSPRQVLAMPRAPEGVPEEKWRRIGGLAEAALRGDLDAAALRALSLDEAMARLSALRGVGAWTAAHIYLRGAAPVDEIALHEPRVVRAVQNAYGMKHAPSDDELLDISERWRPFRTWAMILVALHLNRTGRWHDAKDGEARARRSRGGRGRV